MVTRTDRQTQSWQRQLAQGIADPRQLLQQLSLGKHLANVTADQQFRTRVPQCFVARMRPGDIDDPLLRQVLPLSEELTYTPGFSHDPLAEAQYNPLPGLLHKYHGRVLLTLTGSCAINCRYCFRRHFPYAANNPGGKQWIEILHYLNQDATIREVIFSGGDPLLLNDQQLAKLSQQIAAISHIKTLRIHSRLPVVLPDRITPTLIKLLSDIPLQNVLVIHCNHANEIDNTVKQALQQLKTTDVTLLNQSVLLKGVNDNAEVLIALSEALFACGVLPYYLHLLDKTQGTAHFAVSESLAKTLHRQMRQRLPGYLVPKLVQEIAGKAYKLPLG